MDRDVALSLKTALNNLKTNLQTLATHSYPTEPTDSRNIEDTDTRELLLEDPESEIEPEPEPEPVPETRKKK